jgi:hypothetical protein
MEEVKETDQLPPYGIIKGKNNTLFWCRMIPPLPLQKLSEREGEGDGIVAVSAKVGRGGGGLGPYLTTTKR